MEEQAKKEMCVNERRGLDLCHAFGQENYRIHESFKAEGKKNFWIFFLKISDFWNLEFFRIFGFFGNFLNTEK